MPVSNWSWVREAGIAIRQNWCIIPQYVYVSPELRKKHFLGERYTLFSPTYLMRGVYGEEKGEVSPID